MQTSSGVTYFFIPPVRRAAGGVAVLCRMAAILRRAGIDAALALRDASGWKPEPGVSGGVPEIAWEDVKLTPNDLWAVPEGWPNALAPGFAAKARCLVYVQNWAYLFSGLPEDVTWRSLPVSFMAVSRPVSWFTEQATGLPAPVVRPGIDLGLFAAPQKKPDRLAVAYMPRKNKALAEQIRRVIASRGRFDVRWVEIAGLDQSGVAQALAQSHVFLATGFPEGCPLPPLEAMACGAVPVGFAGLGGFDYMRQADPAAWTPGCPMDETVWGGNGFFVPDNDVLGAALALERALALWSEDGEALARVRANCALTAKAYGLDVQRDAVLDFWAGLGYRPG